MFWIQRHATRSSWKKCITCMHNFQTGRRGAPRTRTAAATVVLHAATAVLRHATASALAIVLIALTPTAALAIQPRASLTDIENDVMCVACHESLAVAQSPEAYSEREFIRGLINQGLTKKQIENQLVAQYGPSVLGKPPAHGFDLVVYVVPALIVVGGVVLLVVTIPKWRRRAKRAASAERAAAPPLNAADAKRLEDDLARQN
jgi:cytochrome c-type biogenesis protein CcmH